MKRIKRKGQIWTLDFIASLLMFIGIIFITVNFLGSETPIQGNEKYEQAQISSDYISNLLLTQGQPSDWNSSDVIIPGIVENQRVNITKLERFDELTYEQKKDMLQVNGDFLMFFENSSEIINKSKCFRGYDENTHSCTLNLSNINYENLAKTERIVLLDSQLVNLNIYVWN